MSAIPDQPEPPFIVVDRDGWVSAYLSVSALSGGLEELDVAGGEYRIFDRYARRVQMRFEKRLVHLSLQGVAPQWDEARSAIDPFFASSGSQLGS